MEPVLEIAMSALAAVFGAGSAWMGLKASVKNVTQTVAAHERTLDDHSKIHYQQLQKIADQSLVFERMAARVLVLEHAENEGANRQAEERRNTQKTLAWQNEMLMEIHGRTGATRKDSSQFRAVSRDREEQDSEVPKPMRPRLPTLRGDEK